MFKSFLVLFFKKELLACFLFLSLPTALSLALITPPGHVPDEPDHACRADSLRYGAWIAHREISGGWPVSGVPCNLALRLIVQLPAHPTDTTPEAYTPQMQAFARIIPWEAAPQFLADGSIGGYMPAFYVPGALAITATRWAGGSPAQAFLAIRLVNLACFAAIGALALAVTRRGAALMACTLLLPMSLSLAASCSQDGLLIACATLACAALTRAQEGGDRRWFALAALCLALVIAGKPPYAPLALLLLTAEPRRIWRNGAAIVAAVTPGALWVVLELHFAAIAPYRPAALSGPLWPGTPMLFEGPDFAAQFHVLLTSPKLFVTLPFETIRHGYDILAHQLVGVLGYMCVILPHGLYYAWFAALVASGVADSTSGVPARRAWTRTALIPPIAVWLAASCVGLALYLQWTPVGMPWIGGLEGRYFIPLLPALAMALPALHRPAVRMAARAVPIAAALATLVWLPVVMSRFYAP